MMLDCNKGSSRCVYLIYTVAIVSFIFRIIVNASMLHSYYIKFDLLDPIKKSSS